MSFCAFFLKKTIIQTKFQSVSILVF